MARTVHLHAGIANQERHVIKQQVPVHTDASTTGVGADVMVYMVPIFIFVAQFGLGDS